jgi:hypothetical protein
LPGDLHPRGYGHATATWLSGSLPESSACSLWAAVGVHDFDLLPLLGAVGVAYGAARVARAVEFDDQDD